MTDVNLSWMNNVEFNGRTWAENNAPVDLSWMNVPGPDGLTWAQKNAGAPVDLSWMNIPGPDGLTWAQKNVKPPAGRGTEDQNNAYNQLKKYLIDFKLDSLIEPLWTYIMDSGVRNDDELWLWMQDRPEFATRFPGFKKLQEEGRAISPTQYMELEKSYASVMRGANIPSTFFDKPDDFTDLIVGNVSPAEFQSRVEKGYKRVAESDDLIKEAFKSYFGVEGNAALAAFFIDPDRSAPALERAVQAAEIQSAALRSNSSVDLSYASKLTDMGVSYEQAMQGFQRLNTMQSLFAAGIGESTINSSSSDGSSLRQEVGQTGESGAVMDESTQQGVDFLFGTDTGVQRELQMRLAKRKAESSGVSQQVVANREGQTALGTAD